MESMAGTAVCQKCSSTLLSSSTCTKCTPKSDTAAPRTISHRFLSNKINTDNDTERLKAKFPPDDNPDTPQKPNRVTLNQN